MEKIIFGGCPNKGTGIIRLEPGVIPECRNVVPSTSRWLPNYLGFIGMVPVKLFIRKCSGIILEENYSIK